MYEKRTVRQVGHLQELYRGARSTKHKNISSVINVYVSYGILRPNLGYRPTNLSVTHKSICGMSWNRP